MARNQPTGVRDVTSTIRARHLKQLRIRMIRIIILATVVLLIGATVWVVWFSPLLIARSVVVSGNAHASTAEIIETAEVPIGTPLVAVDTQLIEERVMTIPVMAEVVVRREITGVVKIVVTEAKAAYIIPISGLYLVVSDQGKGFDMVPEPPEGLPTVNMVIDDSEASVRLMVDAAAILQALPESVRSLMTLLGAQTPDTFLISLNDGRQILWGSTEDSELKATVIEGLLNVPASYYDISSPSHPATR